MTRKHEDLNAAASSAPGAKLRAGFLLAGLLALLVGGVILSIPLADAAGGWQLRANHARWGHSGGFAHSPEKAREHTEFAVEWMLSRIDTSQEQRSRVAEILGEFVEELLASHDQHREHADRLVELLSSPVIDRDALDGLRAAELELADDASSRLIGAIADAAEVLTAEQRLALLEWAQNFAH